MVSIALWPQFSLSPSYAGLKMDLVTLLSCRTQGISHSAVQYPFIELCCPLTFVSELAVWFVSWKTTDALKIVLFGAMNYRKKIMFNDDTI